MSKCLNVKCLFYISGNIKESFKIIHNSNAFKCFVRMHNIFSGSNVQYCINTTLYTSPWDFILYTGFQLKTNKS